MTQQEEGMLLRIFINGSEKTKGQPLYEVIVNKARELKLAGATVIKGMMGFGADSHMHTTKLLRLSENLPMIIEIVDYEPDLMKIIPFLDEIAPEGMVTLEKVKLIKYRHLDNKDSNEI